MPKPAEFSEREYMYALSAELIDTDYPLRSPGQVLENYFGFEAVLSVTRLDFWGRLAYAASVYGEILSDLNFGYIWRRLETRRPKPDFDANLFLLAHCPELLVRRSPRAAEAGIDAPFWRFDIHEDSQRVLSRLQEKLSDRALVFYAGPAFTELDALYRFTNESTVINNTSFVNAATLTGRKRWIYDHPGAMGVTYPGWEEVKEKAFVRQLEPLVQTAQDFSGDTDSLVLQLHALERALIDVCVEEAEENNRRAIEILRRMNMIASLNNDHDLLDRAIRSYVKIRTFTSGYNLIWCAVG